MATISLTPALRIEYDRLFETCIIRPERTAEVKRLVDKLLERRARYEAVEAQSGVPWFFVGAVHTMESGGSFAGHLHNGDPLTARTRQVPAGRPPSGSPPFTWEESAADALAFKRLGTDTDWTLAGTLYQLERYNGWGYRRFHPHVLSPYLWSFSTHYVSGKYVADGRWSETAVSKQCGAAVLLRRLAERREITFPDQPTQPTNAEPLIVKHALRSPTNEDRLRHGRELQAWLNTYPGIFVRVDGWPGNRTSDAYQRVTGHLLPGDPRAD